MKIKKKIIYKSSTFYFKDFLINKVLITKIDLTNFNLYFYQ